MGLQATGSESALTSLPIMSPTQAVAGISGVSGVSGIGAMGGVVGMDGSTATIATSATTATTALVSSSNAPATNTNDHASPSNRSSSVSDIHIAMQPLVSSGTVRGAGGGTGYVPLPKTDPL